MAKAKNPNRQKLPLKARVTCPHCWNLFAPGDIMWVSAHPDLQGDEKLGPEAQARFLPSRFTVRGEAIDIKGEVCNHLACPNCHLVVSRALVEMSPLFISILGAPSSGKSNFLAAMTWKMRTTLLGEFGITFVDSDPGENEVLNEYEQILFKNRKPDSLVELWKTQVTDAKLSNSVFEKGRAVFYPKPFVFSLLPEESRFSDRDQLNRLTRALCLYDNAGEHFMPGGDATGRFMTKHLGLSSALIYLFDPTQHYKFRQACEGKSNDPQLSEYGVMNPQEGVIAEAASRIKTQKGISQQAKCPQPLIVVVTKYDAWSALTNHAALDPSWLIKPRTDGRSGLDLEKLHSLSGQVENVLNKYSPELVAAARGNFQEVTYIPISALGTTPEVDPSDGRLKVRPRNIKPQFAEVPLLYALHRSVEGLIPSVTRETRDQSAKPSKTKSSSGGQKARQTSSAGHHRASSKPSAPTSEIPLQETKAVSLQSAETKQDPRSVKPAENSPNETYLKETGP